LFIMILINKPSYLILSIKFDLSPRSTNFISNLLTVLSTLFMI